LPVGWLFFVPVERLHEPAASSTTNGKSFESDLRIKTMLSIGQRSLGKAQDWK
jgi:hypothetical protein